MKAKMILPAAVALSLSLGGCATDTGPREQTGMVVGGALGGILGHQVGDGRGQVAATIVGTLLGAAIGGSIGQSMDEVDRMKMGTTLETVRTGVTSEWKNPDTNNQYAVTPTRTFYTPEGPCREYTMDAQIGGSTEKVYGTACRQADGSWKVES